MSASRTPLAITPISDSTVIDLGARALTLVPWETAHSESDLTVFDTATATLFVGDLLFDEHSPALDGSLLGWLRVLDEMGTPPPARVVPGHGGPVLDWPKGGEALTRYLETLRDETRIAVAEGLRLSEAVATVGKDKADNWHLFELFHRRNVTAAFTELEWE
ncbi:hypothetical protein ROG8370_02213 [Roseovarius gaetbuli]|uniref:Metallo-beta-lactamase domain-containing protein n=1 Tax=Roseovarius gaetbuli TaxID=1356575 RepID=A0A1X6ZET9_9RHOB|nr:MBL fold metallo-hydrolase [Roseovarius gaetbuli]SLN49696.1 hypothetical protein ROG8370_02213 [Roseovarius gaetbuli]